MYRQKFAIWVDCKSPTYFSWEVQKSFGLKFGDFLIWIKMGGPHRLKKRGVLNLCRTFDKTNMTNKNTLLVAFKHVILYCLIIKLSSTLINHLVNNMNNHIHVHPLITTLLSITPIH